MRIRTCKVCGGIIEPSDREILYKREVKTYCGDNCKYIANLIQALRKAKIKSADKFKIMAISKYILNEMLTVIIG